jgi:hypothetical protein
VLSRSTGLATFNSQNPVTIGEAAFAAYAQAVENCRKEIAGFVESLEKANGTFARANQSQATNPKGIKSWRASEHPDWADMNRKRRRVDQ